MVAPNTYASFETKFIPEPNSGCWLWLGRGNGRYGRLRWHGKNVLAHVFSYEWHVSPIPIGKELDHLCRNTYYVNPDHLEPVTHKENMMRGKVAKKTHCKNGHAFNEKNTGRNKTGNRYCRECLRLNSIKYYWRDR